MRANGMTATNMTDKKIITPSAILRCCPLAGMLAISAGYPWPASLDKFPGASFSIRKTSRSQDKSH